MNHVKFDHVKNIRVGIGSRNYSYRRVAYALPTQNVSFIKSGYVPWKFLSRRDARLRNSYLFNPFSGVDLFHVWNGIVLNNKPWISTFEHDLPRYSGRPRDKYYEIGVKKLHSENCRRLLALSEYAYRRFLFINSGLINDSVIGKLEVFYGAVELKHHLIKNRSIVASNSLRLCFVGHDFFRKGGQAVLSAFEILKKEFPGLSLTVVSQVNGMDYVTKTSQEDVAAAKSYLSSKDGISWFSRLPHNEVLELLSTCDIGLLPTLDDTFGWSILESMSVGLPVIATDICAVPEMISDGVNGYLIPIPRTVSGRWLGMEHDTNTRKVTLKETNTIIVNGLVSSIRTLFNNRSLLSTLSQNAIRTLQAKFDPETQASKLRGIYERALNRSIS